jgi:hypothetical protein
MFPQDKSNSSFPPYSTNEAPASVYFHGLACIAESDSALPIPSNSNNPTQGDGPLLLPQLHEMGLLQQQQSPPPGFTSMINSISTNSNTSEFKSTNSLSSLVIQPQQQPPSHQLLPQLSSASPVASISTIEQHKVLLKDWLPEVLDGFPSSLIDSFVQALQEDGFISVTDLTIAQSMDQLTFEYLRSMGFKMGHFNRLITSLKSFST